MGLIVFYTFYWQLMVIRGKAMKNPDGTVDDWHEQKNFYGMAFADVIFACPLCIAGIILIIFCVKLGFYFLAIVSFWFIWGNIQTTATSLRFEKPKITLNWIFYFPLGIIFGIIYIIWTIINFEYIYCL